MKKEYGKRQDYECETVATGVYRISDYKTANCYLVLGTEKAMLIDMGTGIGDLKGFIRTLTLLPLIIVATHGHVDHIGGCGQFEQIYLHPADFKIQKTQSTLKLRKSFLVLQIPTKKLGISQRDVTKAEFNTELLPLEDGMVFDLGNKTIKAVYAPGHTPGSMLFLDEQDKIMFTGDNVNPVLFMFLPDCMSLQEWLPNAKIARELSQTYKPFCGHDTGTQTYEQIDKIIKFGEQILAKYKKNAWLSRVRIYPKLDLKRSIFFRTGNIYKKSDPYKLNN